MKITVTFTIEVDADKWAEYNGLNDRREVRDDVKSYVLTNIQNAALIEESDATVTLKR